MAEFRGMNVERGLEVSQQMERTAQEFRTMANLLTANLRSVNWTGPRARQFEEKWGAFKQQLFQFCGQMDVSAGYLRQEAENQAQVSGAR